MTVTTLDDASREFSESVDYYENKEPGLGRRFRNEVALAITPPILKFLVFDHAVIGVSTCAHFLIILPTSFAKKRFGSWRLLTRTARRSFGLKEPSVNPIGRLELCPTHRDIMSTECIWSHAVYNQ